MIGARARWIKIGLKARVSALSAHFRHSPCLSLSSFFVRLLHCEKVAIWVKKKKNNCNPLLLSLTSTAIWLTTTTKRSLCTYFQASPLNSAHPFRELYCFYCAWRYNLKAYLCVCAHVGAHTHALIQTAVIRNYMYVQLKRQEKERWRERRAIQCSSSNVWLGPDGFSYASYGKY